ncbi:MAG: chemotaxis protein CheW [Burkholderiaceae bacterium]
MNSTAADLSRFGTELAGVPVLMPAGIALEFVPAAGVHPLPLAPRRVRGLMQLRGQPLLVIDPADPAAPGQGPATTTAGVSVLVVGTPPEAAALVVPAAPRAVRITAPVPARAPRCGFADALGTAHADAARAGGFWFDVDPEQLFAALMRD